MMIESTGIDTFMGFWKAIENAKGATDKDIGRYYAIDFSEKTELLKEIWMKFKELIKENPHFSEEEREIVTEEAKEDWDKAPPRLKHFIIVGVSDSDFGVFNKSDPERIERELEGYTRNQWDAAHPDKPLPKAFSAKNQLRRGQPARFTPKCLESQLS